MPRVYLDHNATSPMTDAVRRAIASASGIAGGNPSSPHAEGRAARRWIEEAREELARHLPFDTDEIIFTSGGTEANNLALRGMAGALAGGGHPARIVTSAVEHPSVLETCRALARLGAELTVLPVDAEGLVDPASLDEALRRAGPAIVSIIHAGNETGVIQPIEDLSDVAASHGALFHSDMVQSLGRLPLRAMGSRLSACSVAAHKIGGPVGIGALALRRGTPLEAQMTGGSQEGRRRAGSEPAPLAAGFAESLRSLHGGLPAEIAEMRDGIEEAARSIDPGARVHGGGAPRLGNTTSIHVPGAPGRTLVMQLDLMGFAVSTGSACSTGSARPSHVLQAMGCGPEEARDSIRVSLGARTTRDEVQGFIRALREAAGMAAAGRGTLSRSPMGVR